MNWKIFMCLVICASMKHAFCGRVLRDVLLPIYTPRNIERAQLEEGPGYETYGHAQMEDARQRGILPLTDTISEKDKYGNDGGQTREAANTFMNIFEDQSGYLSRSLGEPNNRTVNILAGVNPLLAELGAKIGGTA